MKSNEYNIALYIAFVFPLHSRYITGTQAPASSHREARPQKPALEPSRRSGLGQSIQDFVKVYNRDNPIIRTSNSICCPTTYHSIIILGHKKVRVRVGQNLSCG